jgi:hypothetical protein
MGSIALSIFLRFSIPSFQLRRFSLGLSAAGLMTAAGPIAKRLGAGVKS